MGDEIKLSKNYHRLVNIEALIPHQLRDVEREKGIDRRRELWELKTRAEEIESLYSKVDLKELEKDYHGNFCLATSLGDFLISISDYFSFVGARDHEDLRENPLGQRVMALSKELGLVRKVFDYRLNKMMAEAEDD